MSVAKLADGAAGSCRLRATPQQKSMAAEGRAQLSCSAFSSRDLGTIIARRDFDYGDGH